MKFAYLPKPKDEPIADLEANGHEHVALEAGAVLVLADVVTVVYEVGP